MSPLRSPSRSLDFLLDGAITNALNFPSISAEERPKLMPFLKLAEQLGSFALPQQASPTLGGRGVLSSIATVRRLAVVKLIDGPKLGTCTSASGT